VIKRLAEVPDAAYGLGLSGKLIGSSARTYRRDSLARWWIDPHTLRTYGCRACGVWVTEGSTRSDQLEDTPVVREWPSLR
jgi:hypothetical protein